MLADKCFLVFQVLFAQTNLTCSLPHLYTEGVCHSALLEQLNTAGCLFNQTMAVHVAANREAFARSALSLLNQTTPTHECMVAIMPFLCHFLFGLCDIEGETILPTFSTCEEIKLTKCAIEWRITSSLGFELPDCQMLPDELNISCPSESEIGNECKR